MKKEVGNQLGKEISYFMEKDFVSGDCGWPVDIVAGDMWVIAGEAVYSCGQMNLELLGFLGFMERDGEIKKKGGGQMGKQDDDVNCDIIYGQHLF